MLDKVDCYPPEWVYKVVGHSSPAMNKALICYATALLLAIEQNERDFADPRFWGFAEDLRRLASEIDHASPDIGAQIAARLQETLPPQDILDRSSNKLFELWVDRVRNLTTIQAKALLVVVESTDFYDETATVWWTKKAFLVRKGILQKGA